MTFKRNLLVAALGVAAIAAAGSASAETRWEHNHPRQDQVLDRDAHQRHEIRAEARAGEISPAKAHRLLRHERQIAREDHRMAHRNGGYITKAEQHRLNRQENRVARHMG
jgi:hypothetical protein